MPSSSSTVSSSSFTIPQNFTITNILHHVPIKLERTTYLLWRAQFLPVLRSQDLLSFVDGTQPAPPKFLTSTESQTDSSVNPEYTNGTKLTNCSKVGFLLRPHQVFWANYAAIPFLRRCGQLLNVSLLLPLSLD